MWTLFLLLHKCSLNYTTNMFRRVHALYVLTLTGLYWTQFIFASRAHNSSSPLQLVKSMPELKKLQNSTCRAPENDEHRAEYNKSPSFHFDQQPNSGFRSNSKERISTLKSIIKRKRQSRPCSVHLLSGQATRTFNQIIKMLFHVYPGRHMTFQRHIHIRKLIQSDLFACFS